MPFQYACYNSPTQTLFTAISSLNSFWGCRIPWLWTMYQVLWLCCGIPSHRIQTWHWLFPQDHTVGLLGRHARWQRRVCGRCGNRWKRDVTEWSQNGLCILSLADSLADGLALMLNTVTKVIYHTSLLIDCVILLLVSRCTTPGT